MGEESLDLQLDASCIRTNPFELTGNDSDLLTEVDYVEVEANVAQSKPGPAGHDEDLRLEPALKARLDHYVRAQVAALVGQVEAQVEARLDELQSRVDELKAAQPQQPKGTPTCPHVKRMFQTL